MILNRFYVYTTAVALFLSVMIASWSLHETATAQNRMRVKNAARDGKVVLMMNLLDAETGQRGFIVTGDEVYLQPYFRALTEIPKDVQRLGSLALDRRQRAFLDTVQPLIAAKLDELRFTIDLRRDKSETAALAVIRTDRGKLLMDQIRTLYTADAAAGQQERDTLEERIDIMIRVTLYAGGAGIVLLMLITALLSRQAAPPVPPEIRRHQQSLDSIERSIAALLTDEKPAENV
jgi:CHASE3 domain sensor protein